MSNQVNDDISNLSHRMTTQLELAMNDLKNVKRNIKQINSIIKREPKNNSERKIDNYEEKYQIQEEEKNMEEEEIPAAGFVGRQHNMTHNRWISSLRHPFGMSYY